MHRRDVLKIMGAAAFLRAATVAAAGRDSAGQELRFLGEPQPFDYAALKGRARSLAAQPYQAPAERLPAEVKQLDWDQYQSIRFQPDHALWADDRTRFTIRFFHMGLFFELPVRIHALREGLAREVAYDAAMFDHSKSGLAGVALPPDLGFAGFRVLHRSDPERDIAAFLGASYFRAVGAEKQYGLSARGLAVDTGLPRPEEFPRFTDFWLERPDPSSERLSLYALLDSPSISGAYRFDIVPGATLLMDVDASLYPRKEIERIGIAPLTSMYLHGENDRRVAIDWRPEIHDSDGLALWTGNGERIWRPLVNPEHLAFNAYGDENPRGFGLMQRDRDFAHYQDDGAFYNRRPSLWVEPHGSWGKGEVSLLEIPTADETSDNIVAFWHPQRKPQPGEEMLYSYRLHWGARTPGTPAIGYVVATHTGIGGVVGRPRTYYSRRFVVDFAGEVFSRLPAKAEVEPVITASRGEVEITSARPLHPIKGYRAMFDLKPTDERTDPINLRLCLRSGGKPLTETWAYQWTPPPADRRKF
ncbi:MAG: glucan biosynthesis protein D [Betaproteobacteria bacterium]|nr:glucan biosynthesis protein D [Betaproteobacteria bacterium]